MRRLKPDPLNLLVNTGVGSKCWDDIVTLAVVLVRVFLFEKKER